MDKDCVINIKNMNTKLDCENCKQTDNDINKCLNIAWKESINANNIDFRGGKLQ